MKFIKLVAVFICSLGLMACGSSLGTETLVVTPPASALTMSFTPTKAFRFTWPAATGATYYNLKEAATVDQAIPSSKRPQRLALTMWFRCMPALMQNIF